MTSGPLVPAASFKQSMCAPSLRLPAGTVAVLIDACLALGSIIIILPLLPTHIQMGKQERKDAFYPLCSSPLESQQLGGSLKLQASRL